MSCCCGPLSQMNSVHYNWRPVNLFVRKKLKLRQLHSAQSGKIQRRKVEILDAAYGLLQARPWTCGRVLNASAAGPGGRSSRPGSVGARGGRRGCSHVRFQPGRGDSRRALHAKPQRMLSSPLSSSLLVSLPSRCTMSASSSSPTSTR